MLRRASVSPRGFGGVEGDRSALSPENALRSLLEALTSPPYAPTQHLEREQALAKQFAEILHFTLSFDELKVPPCEGRQRGGVPTPGLCLSCEPAESPGTPNPGVPPSDDQPCHPERLQLLQTDHQPESHQQPAGGRTLLLPRPGVASPRGSQG